MAEDKNKAERETKYEKARIIGSRALQISAGAPFMLKLNDEDLKKLKYSTLEIAKLEFEKGLIPITVYRPMPKTPEDEKAVAKKLFAQLQISEEKQSAEQ